MATNSEKKVYFEVSTWSTGSDYYHLQIRVLEGYKPSQLTYSNDLFKLTWQTDWKAWHELVKDNDGELTTVERKWYAGKVEIEATSLDRIVDATRILRRFFGGKEEINDLWSVQPIDAIKRLSRFATEVANDKRLGDYVEMELLAPYGWHAYTEDWKQLGQTGPQVKVMAPNEVTAKRNLMLAMVNNHYSLDEYMAQWIHSGKPVYTCEESSFSQMAPEDCRNGSQKATENPWGKN